MTPVGLTVDDLACFVPGSLTRGNGKKPVLGVAYDSRLVQPGDLFAALRGGDFDGHAFVADAAAHGAAALLVEEFSSSSLPQILVHDTRAALALVSARLYGHPSRELGVIGITGTDGKTTTSFLIDHILRSVGQRTGMIGTVAVRIGEVEDIHASRQTTPESSDIQRLLRQMVEARVDWAVLEATSHGLAMHRLDEVTFTAGAVTNVTHEHLDFHGSVTEYRRAKAILIQRVAADGGMAIINIDDPGARALAPYASGASILTFSPSGGDANLRAVNARFTAAGSQFTLVAESGEAYVVDLPLVGEFNVANALCAAGIALAAGVGMAEIAAALRAAPPVPGRMTPIDSGQPFQVVVDYAHTPDALEKVLRLLRALHPTSRLIAVFGSAGERDREKRPAQGRIAGQLADVTIVTSEDPRFEDADAIIAEIAAGAEAAGARPGATLFYQTDRRDAIRFAFGMARPGDCVLLAGKGHERSIIWGREKVAWDEAGVARELLADAGYVQS